MTSIHAVPGDEPTDEQSDLIEDLERMYGDVDPDIWAFESSHGVEVNLDPSKVEDPIYADDVYTPDGWRLAGVNIHAPDDVQVRYAPEDG